MKIEWSAEDIEVGRIVGKPDLRERWMIGYLAAGDPGPSDRRYVLVSLSDGMVTQAETKNALAILLNKNSNMPVEFFSDPSHVKRGQKGGAARAAALSPERRAEIASAAANSRWQNGQR